MLRFSVGTVAATNRRLAYSIRQYNLCFNAQFGYIQCQGVILSFMDNRGPIEIQLDWLDKGELVQEQMEVYAKFFQIRFEGVKKKEI